MGAFAVANSADLKARALLYKGKTLVPLRAVAEWLGAQVEWQRPTITITKDGKRVVLTLGERTATKDEETVLLSVPPRLIRGTTYVPLRFVAEALGAEVEFHEDLGTITLVSGGQRAEIVVVRYKFCNW